ncbi:Eco57I restriction-modification methylase domain-containing protein [Microbacterium sp. R86528]|uniref:Eco57I restriction-modification methylase domain-containing protein n=1 Tax=Microbacterium sp. R86528 TaxID=3093864 RepID=UPI0037C76406
MIEGPATFDDEGGERGIRTLVLACSSEDLELATYKPDFPASIPHITLYDGPPSAVASAALRLLTGFPWGLRLHTTLSVHGSSHEALLRSSATDRGGIVMTTAADALRGSVFLDLGLGDIPIAMLTADQRIAVVEAIARAIHVDGSVSVASAPATSGLTPLTTAPAGQLAFWSPEEVWSITGEGPRHRRADQRKRGSFPTPPELARDVAAAAAKYANLDPSDMVDFGDPAVGNGVLYAAAREAVGGDRINSARVVEIDETTARSTNQRWRRSGISVLTGDFLGVPAEEGAWSLVLANPPYRRSQDISQDLSNLRGQIASRLGIKVTARADLYVYFVLQADAWIRQGGVAAWILPSEFQVTGYGAALRSYLSTKVELLRLHTYDSRDPLFDNALASTCVVILRKNSPSPGNRVMVSTGGTLSAPIRVRDVSTRSLALSPRWSFAALDRTTHPAPDPGVIRLGEIFTFRRGIATGANSYFVLSDSQLEKMDVHRQWVRPLAPRAREVRGGRIGRDIDGNPIPASGRWLIDTPATIDEIRSQSPTFAEYLQRVEAAVGDRYLVARRPSSFKQEPREPAPFLFVYMAKRDGTTPRFLMNESRAIHLNNLIGMYPKESLWERFADMEEVFAALRSIGVAQLELAGRSYGNGLLKLEPRELTELRVAPGKQSGFGVTETRSTRI